MSLHRILVVLFTLLALCACTKPVTPLGQGPASVTVAKPVPKQITEWDEFTGRLAAVESVEVRARVSGYLQSCDFHEGKEVKKGELLFVIDARAYAADLARAQAEESRAQSALELATLDAQRASKLVETRAISAEEADAKSKMRQQAAATLKAAQAARVVAELQVEFTRVTAPISGRIGGKLVTAGNLIVGGASGTTLLTTIVSMDPIYCYMDVDEHSSLKYRELRREGKRSSALDGTIPAQMALANETGWPHEGVVDFVDNVLSTTTGSIKARAIFANPDGLMAPGFFARVRIPGSGIYEAMLVRDNAIGSDQGKPFVYIVSADGKATPRPVVTGPLEGGLRIVRKGLKADDRVVVNGLMAVRPGAIVKAEETTMIAQ